MHLIGICGKKQSGKDTAAKALVKRGYTRIAFAGPLKIMVAKLFQCLNFDTETIGEMLNGSLKEMPISELGGHTTRYLLQTLGTEWGRASIDKDIWINIAIATAQQYRKAVITDVRFPNEAEAIKEADGIVIRILRGTEPYSEKAEHESEAVDNIVPDFYVGNNGSITELQQEIISISNDYEKRN
jgi:hypothetical protein